MKIGDDEWVVMVLDEGIDEDALRKVDAGDADVAIIGTVCFVGSEAEAKRRADAINKTFSDEKRRLQALHPGKTIAGFPTVCAIRGSAIENMLLES